MCGITGFLTKEYNFNWDECLQLMTTSIVHRGPDDVGQWIDKDAGVALGHRRLSILDLSPAGHQPMHSVSGRYVIVFNGEIYNHNQIRKELEGLSVRQWGGHSDTEVILASVEEWGLEEAVKRFTGMFAIALWDRKERVLSIVRDRLGEKPLYYGWMGNVFLFGSELKALRAHPAWRGEINRDALTLFLRHNYIPAPYSIYKNIFKLLPGTILSLSNDQISSHSYTITPYWLAGEIVEHGVNDSFKGTEEDAVAQLDALLRDVVKHQMVADVPLGAFLSGGVDSSTIVAFMQAQSSQSIKTFTIGFEEESYNEAHYAKEVAKYLGTDHTELYVTPEYAMSVIPKLPVLYDEPFSDSSQIPTHLVSQLTRQKVTVSLSGDGGDELFGGYNRYFQGRQIWNKVRGIPRPLLGLVAKMITSVPPQRLDWVAKAFSSVMPGELKAGRAGDKLHKLAEIIDKESPEALYKELVSHWKSPSSIVLDSREPSTVITDKSQWAALDDFTLRMMYLDTMTYLPDDILVKVDRAAMGVSLETRVPFLDHRVVEFAWKIPLSMKIRNGQGKWLLRQVLYKYVPKELIERPKTGFGIPIDTWLRGPLRDWAEDLLNENRLRQEGFFNPVPIREKWAEHLSGKRNWQYHLWDVLMFQAWLDAQESHKSKA
ncbi:MAG: asparagine synthase (glutamine-hydrolyzing) [Nitrospirota bacterium]